MSNFGCLPLHNAAHFRETCAKVMNKEWPRSLGARLQMLEKSNDGLPYSLVLIDTNLEEGEEVIGHSRLCKVHGKEASCFIESVVIKKSRRGQGLGRILMEKSEEYAKRLGFKVVYLTTHDKQKFYAHIGYDFCDPIISLGSASSLLTDEMMERLFGKGENNDKRGRNHQNDNLVKETESNFCENNTDNSDSNKGNVGDESEKHPASLPPPPPLPLSLPLPPPAIPLLPQTSIKRMDPREISWMKKVLIQD